MHVDKTLDTLPIEVSDDWVGELTAIDQALKRLEQTNPRQARIVECRFFGGLSIEDTALALGISPATVKRDWTIARAWLYREIRKG